MGRKAQSLYLLGMLDHLCHKYEVPLKEEYADLRKTSLDSYLYPKSVINVVFPEPFCSHVQEYLSYNSLKY